MFEIEVEVNEQQKTVVAFPLYNPLALEIVQFYKQRLEQQYPSPETKNEIDQCENIINHIRNLKN